MGELSNMKLEEMKKYKLRHLKYYMMDSIKMEKLKNSMLTRYRVARIRMWIMWITSVVLLFACAMQLVSLGHTWAPKVFVRLSSSSRSRVYESNGYLMVSSNGGLNQMRSGICDMVAIARYLNATLIVPELDKTSFWNDKSQFADIFNVDYFINSLQDQLQILKELPPDMKKRVDSGQYLSMPPVSWSNMTYYHNIILPRLKNYTVLHFQKTDCRLANNGIPVDIQKFRCRVNYNSIRFVPAIEHLGKKIISILKQRGQFLVLHLRYEMDMLAFSGCVEGLNQTEVEELTDMRYAYPWWKEKAINGTQKRSTGACPLTPDETALTLKALGVDPNIQIYIAAGEIYGGERRLDGLRREFPNLVKKETLLPDSDLLPFKNHSSRMAALDYMVAIESDIFVPTYGGNMAKVVEGHRRFLGYRKSINLNKVELVKLIDQYKEGLLSRDKFSTLVKLAHADRMGTPIRRVVVPRKPKEEDYFYTNPQECLPDFDGDNDDF